jgi:hypothetical protein
MFDLVEVFGGMFVLRRIAAADVPTLQAQAQMHPGIAHLETFLAAFAAGRDFFDFFLVRAGLSHESPHIRFAASASRTAASVANVWNQFG